MSSERVVFTATARRAVRSGAAWGAVFGLYTAASAYGYSTTYPTAAARATLARSFAGSAGLAALLELAASVVKNNRLLVDSSILSHIRPVPAAPADWTAAAGLVGLGVLGAAAAIVCFGRRDLASA